MPQLQHPGRLGDPSRLCRVHRPGVAVLHCAEPAVARADVAEDQEGRVPAAEALTQVWAAGALADGVEPHPCERAAQPVELRPPSGARDKPARQSLAHDPAPAAARRSKARRRSELQTSGL